MNNGTQMICEMIRTEKWFITLDLHTKDPRNQLLKIAEELGELISAHLKQHKHNIKSEVGDVLVTLIGYCMQMGIPLEDCLHEANNKNYNRLNKGGTVKEGVYIKNEDITD